MAPPGKVGALSHPRKIATHGHSAGSSEGMLPEGRLQVYVQDEVSSSQQDTNNVQALQRTVQEQQLEISRLEQERHGGTGWCCYPAASERRQLLSLNRSRQTRASGSGRACTDWLFRFRMNEAIRLLLVSIVVFYLSTSPAWVGDTHTLLTSNIFTLPPDQMTTTTTTVVRKKSPTSSSSTSKRNKPKRTSTATAGSRCPQAEPGENITPLNSCPPEPIELYSGLTRDSLLYKRHECIEKIRARHTALLSPLMVADQSLPKSHILLVDPAYHSNVGDHMITLGELEFMKRMAYDTQQVAECHLIQAGGFVPHCNTVLAKENAAEVAHQPAIWHGGGNWGDLWRDAQDARIKSFLPLLEKNFTILSMPQSLYYDDLELDQSDTSNMKANIAKGLWSWDQDASILDTDQGKARAHDRVIFTWREHESYQAALERYPFVKNLMVPDIAFQLGPFAPIPPKEDDPPLADMVVFLRDDKESLNTPQRNKRAIRDVLSTVEDGDRISFTIVDWADRLRRYQSNDYFFTDTAIQLLSAGRVLVCDRLHAAILAYLSGIPFVYINQSTGKISKTLRVAFDSGEGCEDGQATMWARADNLTHAVQLANGFLSLYELKPRRKKRRKKKSSRPQ